MNFRRTLSVVLLLAAAAQAANPCAGSAGDRQSLRKTSEAIRSAFAQGNLDAIMSYHHPEVIKALSYDKYLKGRDAVRSDLAATLDKFHLEFVEHRVENLFFEGNTAVELSTFIIKGTPKNGGDPFRFKGRALVVYVRYKASPTGWASIREMVQSAP